MTIKEAKEQLEEVQNIFPNVKISFPKSSLRIGEQMEFKRSDKYLTRTFLSSHKNLLEACISAHGTIQYATGKDAGIELGEKMKANEFVSILGLSGIKDDVQELENRMNRF